MKDKRIEETDTTWDDFIEALEPYNVPPAVMNALYQKFASHAQQQVQEAGIDPVRVGMLRQWLNENRKCMPMVTNAMILFWLTGDEKYITPPTTEDLSAPEVISK